ncbi:MAG: PUR family DNA/RNA-binding protein [Spirochaetales bacterium]|nr:PUR family DNA/RNA-binding protein [Spirochaetales bacterium]
MGVRGEVYSAHLLSDRRTFFFNVKENRRGDRFLNIVESRKTSTDGFERSQIMVYAEDLESFITEIQKAAVALRQNPSSQS